MRKLLILSMCILPFLGIGSAIAKEDVPPIKVNLSSIYGGGVKLTRNVLVEPLQCYYLSGSLSFLTHQDLGDVDIKVENLLTNEVFYGEFNSLEDQQYALYLGEEAGNYEITCTTSSGEVYVGTLCVI